MDPELEKMARGCVGKKQYSTQGLVDEVIERCERKRGVALRSYKCQLCGQFHIAKVRR